MGRRKAKPKSGNRTFKPGTALVFDPTSFNPEFWDNQSEEDKLKYYGRLGYKAETTKVFVMVCEIKNAPGHCILACLNDQQLYTMEHTDNFREVTEDEL